MCTVTARNLRQRGASVGGKSIPLPPLPFNAVAGLDLLLAVDDENVFFCWGLM